MIRVTSKATLQDSRRQEAFDARTEPQEQGSNFPFLPYTAKVILVLMSYVLGVGPAWRLACRAPPRRWRLTGVFRQSSR